MAIIETIHMDTYVGVFDTVSMMDHQGPCPDPKLFVDILLLLLAVHHLFSIGIVSWIRGPKMLQPT